MTEENLLETLKGNAPTETGTTDTAPVTPDTGTQQQPQAAALATPLAPSEPVVPPGYVPLAASLDERDKRKAAEQRVKELEERVRQSQPKPQAPDPIGDPDGYQAHMDSKAAHQAFVLRAEISETLAIEKHGQDTVDKAIQSFDELVAREPYRVQQLRSQKNPVEWVVQRYKKQERDRLIGDDPDEFVRKRAVELGFAPSQSDPNAAAPKGVQATPQPQRPMPSPSIATMPAATSQTAVAVGGGNAFDAAFKG